MALHVTAGIGGSATTGAVTEGMAYAVLVPLVILFALPLAIIGAFVALAMTGHATNIITGLAVSMQDAVLPITVIAAGI
jgi:hypothetical protein